MTCTYINKKKLWVIGNGLKYISMYTKSDLLFLKKFPCYITLKNAVLYIMRNILFHSVGGVPMVYGKFDFPNIKSYVFL